MKKIALVILNWNGRTFLEKFLPNVIACSPEAEIIVADNASTDDSLTFMEEHFPQVKVIVNESNGGFAKGYNDALKKVEADYYLLLNSDVEVTANWLKPLLQCMEMEGVAGCQPKVLAYDRKHEFEHAGASGGFLDRNYYPFCRGRILSGCEEDHGQYDGDREIFWATGACMLVRSDVFHQLGGFDEDFFAHMEEIDLCWRVKRLGYAFRVVPESTVYHVGGGTLSYLSPRKTFLNFRNSLFMITKNHPGILFFKLFYRLALDGMAGTFFLVQGKPRHLWAVFQAHMSFYTHLSKMLAKRKQLKRDLKGDFNSRGMYQGSILWAYYFKGIRSFDQLNARFFKT
ncbi:MAG: glycosyltransferase family 2 protein [Bacteroidetes bacterium]|nr:MAG: glycosyltransferase family 2 protein [Bacteroidota bacterium]